MRAQCDIPNSLHLGTLLSRMGGQVGQARQALLNHETALLPALAEIQGGSGLRREMQNLDRLSQTLENLADLLAALSGIPEADRPICPESVEHTLSLEALRLSLLSGDGEPAPAPQPAVDIDVF